MTAVLDILRDVEAAGGTVAVEGADLRLRADKPLPDALVNALREHKAEVINLLAAKAAHAQYSETAADVQTAEHSSPAKRKHVSDSAKVAPAPPSTWTGETAEHAAWFLASESPTEPFKLKPGVTVARPAPYWRQMRADVMAGPTGPRAFYGAIQDDLQCLFERFVDVERAAIMEIDGNGSDEPPGETQPEGRSE